MAKVHAKFAVKRASGKCTFKKCVVGNDGLMRRSLTLMEPVFKKTENLLKMEPPHSDGRRIFFSSVGSFCQHAKKLFLCSETG